MSQKFIVKSLLYLSMIAFICSCKKDDFRPVDISSLLPDSSSTNTALDAWIKTNFLDPYNIDVIYHTNSYFHEYDRNVTPPQPSSVEPMLQTILSGYIKPYQDIAGGTFIKKYVFKQLVLWGSTSYDGSNPPVGYAGTASGGIRVNLFGLDGFSMSPAFVTSRLHVIHHEFTHILQQTFIMPADFQQFTAAYYNANWTKTSEDTSHKYGFVSSYASQNPTEDMAETNSTLLVSGQPWFDNWVKTSSAQGAAGLRQKESSIVNYYNNMGIDYRALQKEIQLYIKDSIGDVSATFPYWLSKGSPYASLTVNLSDNMYNLYGQSATFGTVYKRLLDSIHAQSSFLATSVQFLFTHKDSMTVRIPFTYGDGTGNFLGDFDFAMKVDPNTGIVNFTKVPNKAGTTYSNGSYFAAAVANTLQAYLTSNTFVGDWLQYKPEYNVPANLYAKTAGFYVQSDPGNYFYGPLGE